jgi:hypothetical protein
MGDILGDGFVNVCRQPPNEIALSRASGKDVIAEAGQQVSAPFYVEGHCRNQPLRWHAVSEGIPAFQRGPLSPSPSHLTVVIARTSRSG